MDSAPQPADTQPKARPCYRCEYDLTGLSVDVCPECGADVRPARVAWEQYQRRTRRLWFWAAPVAQLPALLLMLRFGFEGLPMAGICMLVSAAYAVSFGIKRFKHAKARWVLIPGVGLGLLLWVWWTLVTLVIAIFVAEVIHT